MSGVNYAEYYETEQALHAVSMWYTDEKEQAFLDFILGEARIPSDGTILEIGGGGAVHGRILARRFSARYLFSDVSNLLVENARKMGLQARQMDGLETTLPGESVAGVLLVGTSTIVHGEPTRRRQFLECRRILQEDGVAVFVTPTYGRFDGMHRLSRNDEVLLSQCGLSVAWHGTWGIIPGRWWTSSRSSLFRKAENLLARTHVCPRDILIAYRSA